MGLERTFYSVSEGVGVVDLCAVVHEPNITCPIEFPFNISLSTANGTAGLSCPYHMHWTIVVFCVHAHKTVTIIEKNFLQGVQPMMGRLVRSFNFQSVK